MLFPPVKSRPSLTTAPRCGKLNIAIIFFERILAVSARDEALPPDADCLAFIAISICATHPPDTGFNLWYAIIDRVGWQVRVALFGCAAVTPGSVFLWRSILALAYI